MYEHGSSLGSKVDHMIRCSDTLSVVSEGLLVLSSVCTMLLAPRLTQAPTTHLALILRHPKCTLIEVEIRLKTQIVPIVAVNKSFERVFVLSVIGPWWVFHVHLMQYQIQNPDTMVV